MKAYFTCIRNTQTVLLTVAIILLSTLPSALVITPQWFSEATYAWLYAVAHFTLFLVMVVRPLADILPSITWVRPLVILRKGVGVLSASIVVSFILAKVIADAFGYVSGMLTVEYWSLHNLALLAHLADISAILLLVTSNNYSKRVLGKNWKRIQRLSYIYFYGSGVYVYVILDETIALYYLAIVTFVTLLAWMRNHGVFVRSSTIQTT